MRPRAASASSIEHSSGSLFISQWFMGGARCGERFPAHAGGLAPEPWLYRVVAYRSPQVHPASAPGAQGTIATVTLAQQPKEAIGPENMSPVVHGREQGRF